MVDEFSRFAAGRVIKNKESESIINAIISEWFRKGLGYPSVGFRCDNGTEFKMDTVEDIARKVGIKVMLTPSHAPWANGIV